MRIVNAGGNGHNDDAILGRPFVTTDAVLVPTYKGIAKISMQNGQNVEMYPAAGRAWDENEEGPGNVLALQDHMIIATASRVNVYTDMKMAMSKLDREVAAAPTDPEPRLRYAEVMFVAGNLDLAIGKLDEAIKVTSLANPQAASAARERIFANAMTFAQKLSAAKDAKLDDDQTQTINGLYDRAAAAAATGAAAGELAHCSRANLRG